MLESRTILASQTEHPQHGGSEETDPENSRKLQQAQSECWFWPRTVKSRALFTSAASDGALCALQYRILLQGCWYELFGGDPDDFPTEMDSRREEQLSQPLLGEESLVFHHSSSYQSLASDDSPVHTAAHLPLFLPGRVLYITEDGPSRRLVHGCLVSVSDHSRIIQ